MKNLIFFVLLSLFLSIFLSPICAEEYSIVCMGHSSEGLNHRYLHGDTIHGTVNLAPTKELPYTGAKWQLQSSGDGNYYIICMGHSSEGLNHRYLHGDTIHGTVNLAPTKELPYTGTKWQLIQLSDNKYALKSMGHSTEGQNLRYLHGNTIAGSINLSPSSDSPYTGAVWTLESWRLPFHSQEVLKSKLEGIPEQYAYNTKFNQSVLKWFRLQEYGNNTFKVQVRWRYKHWEDALLGMLKLCDYAGNFDMTFRYEYVNGQLKLHLLSVSDLYNQDGTGIDKLQGLITKAIEIGAAISGNEYLVWAGTLFDFAMKDAKFNKGDVIGTAANAVYNALK